MVAGADLGRDEVATSDEEEEAAIVDTGAAAAPPLLPLDNLIWLLFVSIAAKAPFDVATPPDPCAALA